MSYELVDATFVITLPAIEKAALLALCRHAHKDGGGSFASVRLLAHEASLSVRSVQNALRALEARNYIVAEGSKAGGKAGQTVTYRILVPNAEVVAAVKNPWTGAPPAPEWEGPEGDGCTSCTPTGAPPAPTGARPAPTGAPPAPKAVREAVREAVSSETVKSGGGGKEGVPPPATIHAGRADKVIQAFYDMVGNTLPANEKQRAQIETIFAGVPGDVAYWAMQSWHRDRTGKLEELVQPAKFLINELPPLIITVCETLKQKYGRESLVRQFKHKPLW
jgi:hypothetical protein